MKEKTITISWSTMDVEQQAEDMGVREQLTDQDIYDVLSLMESEHDATIGINWETIECWIDHVLYEKKKTASQDQSEWGEDPVIFDNTMCDEK